MTQTESITTEDLKATCQNFPTGNTAVFCALELEKRIGANEYSRKVFKLHDMAEVMAGGFVRFNR